MTEILYRIIDANYNRAREALRVMEEYCRFGLNHSALSGQAKQCRHRLCGVLNSLNQEALLASRNTEGDVGKELKVEGQLQRQSLDDCFAAAAKRASEALRALAETTQSLDPTISKAMEQLRFEVYALEKNAILSASARHKFEPVRLYILLNATPQKQTSDVLALTQACIDGGADCIQLRAKNLLDTDFLELAKRFTSLCKNGGVVSIINDRIDIAILSGADGVHLGQTEIPASDARKLTKGPFIIGGSTHNLHELQSAIVSGYDYVGIGPAFQSPTKPHLEVAGPDYLKQAVPVLEEAGVFYAAIGGIELDNVVKLLKIGVRTIAVSSMIENSIDPQSTCRELKTLISNFQK